MQTVYPINAVSKLKGRFDWRSKQWAVLITTNSNHAMAATVAGIEKLLKRGSLLLCRSSWSRDPRPIVGGPPVGSLRKV